MGLFTPGWMTKNNYKRKKGEKEIDNETDQAKLLEIASTAPLDTIRNYAIGRLTDQRFLAKIALDKSDPTRSWPRCVAIGKLTDQEILIDIARNDDDLMVRAAAVKNPHLRDENTLVVFAKKPHESSDTRRAALEKLTDRNIVEDIAKNDSSADIRKAAKVRLYKGFGICLHDFVYGSSYHPDNTGRAVREAKCKICGFNEVQDYGWDDNW